MNQPKNKKSVNGKRKSLRPSRFLFFLAVCFAAAAMLCAGSVTLSFDHFYSYAEVIRTLKTLEAAYPGFMKIELLGKTYKGRDILGVTVNNPKTGPAETKPGFYIDANIHGNEIQGTEAALHTIWYLLENYGKLEIVTRVLDERAFYIIPSMNPDSRDTFIEAVSDPNSPRSGLLPYDNDRDGKIDEDGPEDLDGDGSITVMWKKDPRGRFKPHPSNSNVLIPARPGEEGGYLLLGDEGIDNDGDGRINEDDAGGYDMNRNYGYNWQPEYVQQGAGYYPFCWPETKAALKFLLAHPSIAGAQNYHNNGGMIVHGPGAKNLGDFPPSDERVYQYIAKKGQKILPGYTNFIVYKDMYTVYGGSVDFFHCVLGSFAFVNELDVDPFESFHFGSEDDDEEGGESGAEDEGEGAELEYWKSFLNQLDEAFFHEKVLLGEQYTELKPYKHPLFGDILIGGIKKFGQRVPPLFKLPETCHRNTAFCLFHADQLARLSFDKIQVQALGGGCYQVDVAIKNSRISPSITQWARTKKIHRLDCFKVQGGGSQLLAAGQLVDRFRGTVFAIDCRKNAFWVEGGIPGYDTVDFRLLIKGKGTVDLVYDSLKGGLHKKSVDLK